MKLNTRERLWVGIFMATLVWGIYNYRHVWLTDTTPAAGQRVAQPDTASQGKPAGSSEQAALRAVPHPGRDDAYQAPPWSDDPFNRPWRRATGPPAEGAASRG